MKQAVTEQSDIRHRSPAAAPVASGSSTSASVEFLDNRPEAVAQRRLAEAIHTSPSMVAQRRQLRGLFGEAAQLMGGTEEEEPLQGKFAPVQRQGSEDEELLQGKFEVRQRKGLEEEEPLQSKFEGISSAQLKEEAPKQNASTELSTGDTGLPDNLKSGIESLSGLSMDNVKVHYNSSQPARLNALAYTQGTDIHVAPGQEQHLPHEAWHVVQQTQGRVQPTMQAKGVSINGDLALEREADLMGATAAAPESPNRFPALDGKSVMSQGGLKSLSVCRAGPTEPVSLAAGGLMQLKWIGDDESSQLIWDRQLDGLRWFYDLKTGMMYYEVEEVSENQRHLSWNAGVKYARKREAWVDVGFGPGEWTDSDAEIVPFVPAPQEKIKLGNSNREITRESLEKQAGDFVKSTSGELPESLFEQFLKEVAPVVKSARSQLDQPNTINKNLIARLVKVFTSFDEIHNQAEALKAEINKKYENSQTTEKEISKEKNQALIKEFKNLAVEDMKQVAKGKLEQALKQIVKEHGLENQVDALTAASNLLKRFASNSKKMSDLEKLVEVYNLIRARLLALDIRKQRPIVATHKPLETGDFPRVSPMLKLGSSVIELERSYDVLSRRTGAVTDQSVIHIHEVDLAFVQVFKGVTEAYANPSGDTGEQLIFGGGGGVGEKVFAAEHGGSMGFQADVKKREERFYGLIFPKGFVQHFGMDIRHKSEYDPRESGLSNLKGSVREPNEADFAQHLMPELNGDPEIKIPLSKLFFIRAETSTAGGQVDIHFGWRDMLVNKIKTHHPDFFRQYVLGVVEFTKNGWIIRYQKLP